MATATLEFNPTETLDRDVLDATDLETPPWQDDLPPLEADLAINLDNQIISVLSNTPEATLRNAGDSPDSSLVSPTATPIESRAHTTQPHLTPSPQIADSPSLADVSPSSADGGGGVAGEAGGDGGGNLQKVGDANSNQVFENKNNQSGEAKPSSQDSTIISEKKPTKVSVNSHGKLYEKIWDVEKQIADQGKAVLEQHVMVARWEKKVKDARKELKEATADLIKLETDLIEANEALDDAIQEEHCATMAAARMQHRGEPLSLAENDLARQLVQAGVRVVGDGVEFVAPATAPSLTVPAPTSRIRTVIDPDPAITTDLWVLKAKAWAGGATNAQIEKLNGEDVRTVAQLEEYMRAGLLVPKRVKGLGEAAVDKITDALMAWRAVNPVPVVREIVEVIEAPQVAVAQIADAPVSPSLADVIEQSARETIARVEAVHADDYVTGTGCELPTLPPELPTLEAPAPHFEDGAPHLLPADGPTAAALAPASADPIDAAYQAGCLAGQSGKSVMTNPYEKGGQLWASWDAGWQEQPELGG